MNGSKCLKTMIIRQKMKIILAMKVKKRKKKFHNRHQTMTHGEQFQMKNQTKNNSI